MKNKTLILPGIAVLFICGCGYFHMAPVEVISYDPEETQISQTRGANVSISFSASMDKVKTEQAFSLTQGGVAVPGRFRWNGNTLVFDILQSFPGAGKYKLQVSEAAEDINGNNLRDIFSHIFSVGGDETRPEIAAVLPENGTEAASEVQELIITFTEPMDRNSIHEGFAVEPHVEGSFVWEQNDSRFRFLPAGRFEAHTLYSVAIAGTAGDKSGNTIGEEYRTVFTSGCGFSVPEVDSISSPDESIILSPYPPEEDHSVIAEAWECGSDISILFNTVVTVESVEKALDIFPEANMTVYPRKAAASDTVTIHFPERLAYDTVYTIHLGTAVESIYGVKLQQELRFKLRTNGPASRPPSVERVTFLDNPAGGGIQEYQPYGLLDLGNFAPYYPGEKRAFFDIYFRTAETAELNVIDFIEAFSCSVTNSCTGFDAVAVETENLSGIPPSPPAGEGVTVIRVHVEIEDEPENGVIELRLDSSFKDSRGNSLTADWYFPLNEATP